MSESSKQTLEELTMQFIEDREKKETHPSSKVAPEKTRKSGLKRRSVDEIYSTNLKLLKASGWAGHVLLDPYQQVVEDEPTLAKVAVHDNPYPYYLVAYAVKPWDAPSKETEVYLPLGDDWKDVFGVSRKLKPRMHAGFANQLGVAPENFDDETYLTFAGMHELGHGLQFGNYGGDPAAFDAADEVAQKAVPLGALSNEHLYSDAGREFVKTNRDLLAEAYGVSSIEDLVALRDDAYRQLPLEAEADQFAVKAMRQFAV